MEKRRMPDGWGLIPSSPPSPGNGMRGTPAGRGANGAADWQAEPPSLPPLPVGALLLSERRELAEAAWRALVETLGGVEEVKQHYRLMFQRPLDGLSEFLRRERQGPDVVLLDLQAKAAREFLEREGFALLGSVVYLVQTHATCSEMTRCGS
jgi:hypothetical protein